jgi:hypothetical protein
MPVTLMGFRLQGFSPRPEPSASLEPGYPPGVGPSATETAALPHLQGLTPRRDPTLAPWLLTTDQAVTLMTFHSLGNSPEPPWRRFRFASPHELPQTPQLAPKRRTLSRVLRNRSVGWSLARLPPLMSFVHLVPNSPIESAIRIWLMNSPRPPSDVTAL